MQTPRRAIRQPALTALALAAGLAALAHAPARAQSLNGQLVNVSQRFPNKGTTVLNQGTQTITPAGTTFAPPDVFSLNVFVTPGQVVFTYPSAGTLSYFSSNISFSGYAIAETGASPAAITGVAVDPSSNVSGFDASRVSFDGTDVFADFKGLSVDNRSKLTLNLSFTPAAVPEPSPVLTFAVAALGLGGLILVARRKGTGKKAAAAL